jgi:hypothetical protein
MSHPLFSQMAIASGMLVAVTTSKYIRGSVSTAAV